MDLWPYHSMHELINLCLNPPKAFYFGKMENDKFTVFSTCFFYNFWKFRNKMVFGGNHSILEAAIVLNHSTKKFYTGLNFQPSFRCTTDERWTPPRTGWWKSNCDTAFSNGKAALAVIIRDEDSLMVKALAKTIVASSAYEAEVGAVEWAVSVAQAGEWDRFVFSFDALQVVEEINSAKVPRG